jgi:hypothetical protein
MSEQIKPPVSWDCSYLLPFTSSDSCSTAESIGADPAGTGTQVAGHEILPFSNTVTGLIAGWDYRATALVAGKIASWNDLSGNGKNLVNTVDAYRATWSPDGAILLNSDVGDPASELGNLANIGTYFMDGTTHPGDAGYVLFSDIVAAKVLAVS